MRACLNTMMFESQWIIEYEYMEWMNDHELLNWLLYWLLAIGLNVECLHDWLFDVNIGWLISCMFLNAILMGLSVCVHIHESVYEYVHLGLAHIWWIVEGWGIGVETCIQACEMVLVIFKRKGF